MAPSIYRIQDVQSGDTPGAVIFTVLPAADDVAKPEVGDYLVVHKDNGPPEEQE